MNKLINFLLAVFVVFTISACSFKSSPSTVVKKAYSCLIKEKYNDFYKYTEIREDVDVFARMSAEKLLKTNIEKYGKLKGIEIIEENKEIIFNVEFATVKVREIYERGDAVREVYLKKTNKGWKIKYQIYKK